MDQAKITKARVIRIDTSLAMSAPTTASEPHVTLSPVTPTGTPTMGFFVGITEPTVETPPALEAGNLGIVVWIRDPTTKQWFSSATSVVQYGEAWVCYDVNAADLFFQFAAGYIATAGILHFHVGEL